jgi:hypothetical protein
MTLKWTPLLAVAVLAVGVAGCGGGAGNAHARSRTVPGQVVNLTADPSGDYDFVPTSYTARAGTVTIELYDPLSAFGAQRIAISGHGVHTAGPVVPRGGISRVTVSLSPGRYELHGEVGSDVQHGMTATLAVGGAGSRA